MAHRPRPSPRPSPAASPDSDCSGVDLILDARKSSGLLRAIPHQNLNNNILKRRHPQPRRGPGHGLYANGKMQPEQEAAVPLTKKPFVVRRRLKTEDSDDRDVCFDLSVDCDQEASDEASEEPEDLCSEGHADRDDEVQPRHRLVNNRTASLCRKICRGFLFLCVTEQKQSLQTG